MPRPFQATVALDCIGGPLDGEIYTISAAETHLTLVEDGYFHAYQEGDHPTRPGQTALIYRGAIRFTDE